MTLQVTTSKYEQQILEDFTVKVDLLSNPYQFELSHLFQMAARINKKRSFLFVSKVLGKHLAVDPKICLLTGHLLALRYMEVVHGQLNPHTEAVVDAIKTREGLADVLEVMEKNPIELPNPVTCIGFAETATALGHAVFSTFKEQASYIHTTREQIEKLSSIINFEEEHSHATSHRVYALQQDFFKNDNEVILIDDEITTGQTAVNIIRTLKATYPHKKTFTIVSILDWRTPEHRQSYQALERELDITIHAVSLVEGNMEVIGQPTQLEEQRPAFQPFTPKLSSMSLTKMMNSEMLLYESSVHADGSQTTAPYIKGTGRFGLSIKEERRYNDLYKPIGDALQSRRMGKRTLVIGTGEFMYLPMKIASYMGEGISYQSTTRSPIYQSDHKGYLIQRKFKFDSPENPGLTNYLYNIEVNQYDEIFLFVERLSSPNAVKSLLDALSQTFIPVIHLISMTDEIGGRNLDD
ncbi:phosphoribosyltransferase family protein [Pullulanibacillus sp. KACC 23026]|uniref:phosphoribosyltransferase family protein n=1 Tax=Pullulanibacillus sp. KACC 23026 TaxID=3028315 RepID=UPI0023B057BB|nr:phosphoribosyltransferase family protein [Pullulanibacillus sp. KACC 23026]WEG14621.1 phosphoribosyltransferase family protein [Pullulanibacillus sp. KACC 23026]